MLWKTLWKGWTQKVEQCCCSCGKWFHATGDGRDTTCSLWSNSVRARSLCLCVCFLEVQRFKPSHNPRINTLRLENAALWRMEMMQRVDNLCLAGPWLLAALAARWYTAGVWKTSPTENLCFAAVYLRLCGNELPSSLTGALLNINNNQKNKEIKELQNKHKRSSEGERESATLLVQRQDISAPQPEPEKEASTRNSHKLTAPSSSISCHRKQCWC